MRRLVPSGAAGPCADRRGILGAFPAQVLAFATDNRSGADAGKVSMKRVITVLAVALALAGCGSTDPINRDQGDPRQAAKGMELNWLVARMTDQLMERKSLTTRYGRIGAAPRETKNSFANSDDARRAFDKLIAEKIAKGYRET